jgi:hypothetical protein
MDTHDIQNLIAPLNLDVDIQTKGKKITITLKKGDIFSFSKQAEQAEVIVEALRIHSFKGFRLIEIYGNTFCLSRLKQLFVNRNGHIQSDLDRLMRTVIVTLATFAPIFLGLSFIAIQRTEQEAKKGTNFSPNFTPQPIQPTSIPTISAISNTSQPQPVSSSPTLEEKLAVVDGNSPTTSTQYSYYLNLLETRCKEDRARLADITVSTVGIIKRKGSQVSNLEVLRSVENVTRSMSSDGFDCTEIFALITTAVK